MSILLRIEAHGWENSLFAKDMGGSLQRSFGDAGPLNQPNRDKVGFQVERRHVKAKFAKRAGVRKMFPPIGRGVRLPGQPPNYFEFVAFPWNKKL
jgi:hypothetical protein